MYHIDIQNGSAEKEIPSFSLIRKWAKRALRNQRQSAEVSFRLVDLDEMAKLNSTYRHKSGPTNVLSFPSQQPEGIKIDPPILGDIVICVPVVNQEAQAQMKSNHAHWAHMVVHGIFHLLGYDHENEEEAEIMETLESQVLQSLGFNNPYHFFEDRQNNE